jgi:hypothetical protein
MKKTIVAKAVGQVLRQYGQKWGRDLGEMAVKRAVETARRRGLTDRQIDLDTLKKELGQMHKQGRLNKDELSQALRAAQQAWKNRNSKAK